MDTSFPAMMKDQSSVGKVMGIGDGRTDILTRVLYSMISAGPRDMRTYTTCAYSLLQALKTV